MQVLITDLTRMYDGHVCAAGFDLETGKRVRPVNRTRLPASMLASRGGAFDVGHVVDLGRTRWCGSPPEVEDVLFDVRAAKAVKRLSTSELIDAMRPRLARGLEIIGPNLIRLGRSLVTPQGTGRCSLVAISADEPVRIVVNSQRNERGESERRIRLVRAGGVDLSVTDVRLYESDLLTPDLERIAELQSRLATSPETILCFGLGRAWNGHHYLQLNNLHLAGAPEWRMAPS